MLNKVAARAFTAHVRNAVLALGVFCVLLSGCAERKNDPVQVTQTNFDAAIRAISRKHIVPLIQGLDLQSRQFGSKARDFCASYSSTDLHALQDQWRKLHRVWFALSNYKFGPMIDSVVFPRFTFIDSYRLRGTNYIASVRQDVLADVNGTHPLTQTYFSAKTFQYVGLLPLEVLIFETTDSQDLSDNAVISDYLNHPRKCEVLLQLGAYLTTQTEQIYAGWESGYGDTNQPFRQLFEAGELAVGETPISVLLTSVQEHLDYLNKRNVVANAAPLAGTAWASIRATLEDVSLLLGGEHLGPFTLFSLMEAAGQGETVAEVRENIQFGLTSIDEQDPVNLQLALSLLDGNFKRNIPNALNVNLGINFSDGD